MSAMDRIPDGLVLAKLSNCGHNATFAASWNREIRSIQRTLSCATFLQ